MYQTDELHKRKGSVWGKRGKGGVVELGNQEKINGAAGWSWCGAHTRETFQFDPFLSLHRLSFLFEMSRGMV